MEVLNARGKSQEALERLENLAIRNPLEFNVFLILAQEYEKRGKTGEAKNIYQDLLDLNPKNEYLKGKIEELEK